MPKAAELGVENVEDVITGVFGLTGEINGDEYRIHCPNPQHPDSSPSCDVNLETGFWNCLACGVGGDIASLGSKVLHIKRDDVIAMFRPSTPEALLSVVQRKISAVVLPTSRGRKKAAEALPGPYKPASGNRTAVQELCAERGFHPATLDRWGITYVAEQELVNKKGEPFTIRDSIGIPIRDSKGRLLSWCYRSTRKSPSWQPRYLYTNGTEPSEMWFGLQHNNSERVRHISIGEGALDAAWIDQCGYPALGLLGSKMGDRKVNQLLRYDSVTMFADRDNAGAAWVNRLGSVLGSRMPLFVVLYNRTIVNTYTTDKNQGKLDPQMLAPLDIEISMEQRITWATYKLRAA